MDANETLPEFTLRAVVAGVVCGAIFDDEAVFEAAAATWLHTNTEPAFSDGDSFGVHKLLDLNASIGRDGEIDFRL